MGYAVLALDVECEVCDLASLRRGTATKFAPHITLVPRFPFNENEDEAFAWAAIASQHRYREKAEIHLHGPVWPEPELAWYECVAGSPDQAALRKTHELLLSAALAKNLLKERPRFSGAAYHPHLTVFWRHDEPAPTMPETLAVRADWLSLYSYDTDPHLGEVTRKPLVDLAGRASSQASASCVFGMSS